MDPVQQPGARPRSSGCLRIGYHMVEVLGFRLEGLGLRVEVLGFEVESALLINKGAPRPPPPPLWKNVQAQLF